MMLTLFVRCRRARRRICLALVGAALAVCPVGAQTLFAWPELTANVEQYATLDECLAATLRVRLTVESNSLVWRDTVHVTPAEMSAPLPLPVTETARRCGTRYPEPTASLKDFAPLLQLYLLTGREADVNAIIKRRMSAIAPTAERERAAMLDTIARAFLGMPIVFSPGDLSTQPLRLAAADSVVTALGKMTTAAPWLMRIGAYQWLEFAAIRAGDTARARRAAEGMVAIGSSLTPADRRSTDYAPWPVKIFDALRTLQRDALLDSLRRGTASYVAAQRASWTKASGTRADALDFPIGQPAAPIEGSFWFGRADSSTARPTKGKVALVVFLIRPAECTGTGLGSGVCLVEYAQLRRLAQRFPELEITLVVQTRGFIDHMQPSSPADEAKVMAEHYLRERQLPGALAVTATDFWRLPDPDRRRINRDVANTTHYSFGRSWYVGQGGYFLVDKSGTIVDTGHDWQRDTEERLDPLIEILLSRQTAGL